MGVKYIYIYIYIYKFTVILGLKSRVVTTPVEEVSLIISEATGVVCAVESRRHPWK
jgi:hypothetical protein